MHGLVASSDEALAKIDDKFGARIRDLQTRHRYLMVGPLHVGHEHLVILARHRDSGEVVTIKFAGDEGAAEYERARQVEEYCRTHSIESPLPPSVAYDAKSKAIISKGVGSHDATGTKVFVPARTLEELLKSNPPLFGASEANRERTALVIKLLRDKVETLHAAGIVHRDIKPKNVLVTQDSAGKVRVWLIDLGVARRNGQENGPTIEGTTGYMSANHKAGGPARFADDDIGLEITLAQIRSGELLLP